MQREPAYLRREVVAAVEAAMPVDTSVAATLAAFELGQGDCRLDALEMDSLAMMEFCISLELSTGIELTPEDLQAAGSLTAILALAQGRA